jgi:hypothetical protein
VAVSYAVPAVSGEPKRRPPVVSLAGYLLYLVAVLLIIVEVLPLPYLSKVVNAARDAWATSGSSQTTADQFAETQRIAAIVVAVLAILLAVLLAVIGALVLRGRQVGRILAWIFGGLGALCTLCLSAGALVNSSMTTGTVNGVDTKAINDKIAAAEPSWLRPTQTAVEIIILIALIVVIIALALPASSAFFRKEPEIMVVNDPAFPMTPYPAPQTPPQATPPSDGPSEGPPPGNPPSA